MPLSVTRRRWAAALAAASAVSAQNRPAAPAKESPDQLLTNARENMRRSREAMLKVKLPMAVEPVTTFRA